MRIIFFIFLLSVAACKENSLTDLTYVPEVQDIDKPFANVYQPLDGKWKGTFKIYEDTTARQGQSRPQDITKADLKNPNVTLTNSLKVEQIYTSESPYFQRVEIKDTYTDDNGTTQTIESKGVNKIQDGKMWCVVKKPNETIVHEGATNGLAMIIWQREEEKPQKIEYFVETVTYDSYEIVGWGYYEGDDKNLAPRYWYYGDYSRVVD